MHLSNLITYTKTPRLIKSIRRLHKWFLRDDLHHSALHAGTCVYMDFSRWLYTSAEYELTFNKYK